METKKTALDIACEELAENGWCFAQCEHSDDNCRCFAVKNTGRNDVSNICIEQFKQHFKQQADIPDGWDVIINEIKSINKYIKDFKLDSPSSVYIAKNRKKYLETLCISNGIEVKYE